MQSVISYEVIGGRRGKFSQHSNLNKKLVYDIWNKTRRHIVVVSAYATNCYDWKSHPAASMKNQHFEV